MEMRRTWLVAVLALALLIVGTGIAYAGPLSGAIFTTTVDGSRVNANIYAAKEDVYLDGGPGPNAPQGAAGLPDGDYYFQVTDPSGKVLLSVDPIASRKIQVVGGIIVMVYPAPSQTKYQGKWYGTHVIGADKDHPPAITVQLMPYENTPNPGGVYKVWVTPVAQYMPGEGRFGFIPAWSKTDNFKVKGKPYTPPTITVKKFHDLDADGTWDAGEPEIKAGYPVTAPWAATYTDPFGSESGEMLMPFTIYNALPAGAWSVTEKSRDGWFQTALCIDGVPQTVAATAIVNVTGASCETHTVVFGNARCVGVKGFKFYDVNTNGVWDTGEQPIAGWKLVLTGTDFRGNVVGPWEKYTDASGYACWTGLLPGTYTVTEVLPPSPTNWFATTPLSGTKTLTEGGTFSIQFGNAYKCFAAFGTKGYWHNKNGLAELTEADIAFVNGLAPYIGNPFDGKNLDGSPVPAAKGDWGETIAPAGSWQAEVSAYLVAPNAGGDPKIQLGQQLLAFIFNVQHRLGGVNVPMQLPCGTWTTGCQVIAHAVCAWNEGGAEAGYWAGILDALNNSCAVPYVCPAPGPVVY
jgi:hypothetical protein